MSGPTIDRSNSSGDIWTPQDFRAAVVKKFGRPDWDLAADEGNAFGPDWFNEADDALVQQWCGLGGLLWLNPPFSNIAPWALKCSREMEQILLLVPGSIGANWYWNWVEPYSTVYSVGRMVFDNCFNKQGELVTTPYPKDLILAHYNPKVTAPPRMQRWLWKEDV